ncbi:MAG: hypothetical protein U0T83_09370 [Bacteriovoracaceae bacterium]
MQKDFIYLLLNLILLLKLEVSFALVTNPTYCLNCNKDQIKANPITDPSAIAKILNPIRGNIKFEIIDCKLTRNPHSLSFKYKMSNLDQNKEYGFSISISAPIEEPYDAQKGAKPGFILEKRISIKHSESAETITINSNMEPFSIERTNCSIGANEFCESQAEAAAKTQCIEEYSKLPQKSVQPCPLKIKGSILNFTFGTFPILSGVPLTLPKQKIETSLADNLKVDKGNYQGETVTVQVKCATSGGGDVITSTSHTNTGGKKQKISKSDKDKTEEKEPVKEVEEKPQTEDTPPLQPPVIPNFQPQMVPQQQTQPQPVQQFPMQQMPNPYAAPPMIIDISPGAM